jgi:acetoin utilization protein AcuB
MIARELITDEIPPLKTSDTGIRALSWMDELKVSHLPIVNNNDFLGLISDTDILDLNKPEEPIGNHRLSLTRPFVVEDEHLYEVLKLIQNMKLSLVPVLSNENQYMGVITLPSLIEKFSEISSVSEPGGIIILEVNQADYSLAEISQIVESNDGRILSLYITSKADSTNLEVTIKINRRDLSGIMQTFARYDYTVKATFYQREFTEDVKDRFDSFMNYINM